MRKNVLILFFTILNIHTVYGDYNTHTLDSVPSCDILSNSLYAVYEPIQYNCDYGYYLPANTLGCQSCPTNSVCYGGTFAFNANSFQGIDLQKISTTVVNGACAGNFPNRMNAVYEPNQHTCGAGYYMPANYDGCQQCPANSYCGGGTYAFNETTAQGITSCPNEYSLSAVGATAQTDCYKTCTTNESPHTTSFIGGNYYGGVNTCAPTDSNSCDTGYHYVSANGNNLAYCGANEITINWDDGNGGADTTTCTYGGTITTPTTAPTKRGHTFLGWRFVTPSGN